VPVASGTTLAWLAAHLALAESSWIEERFAGAMPRRIPLPEDRPPTVGEAVAVYREGWARVDAVVAGADLDDVCRGDDTTPAVNLRWVLAHLLGARAPAGGDGPARGPRRRPP
jgi:Protein of unknown function (DUF664)